MLRGPLALAAVLLLASCSPALNWRQVSVPGSPLSAHFPCRPDHSSRRVALIEDQFNVGLTSCRADGQTFAVMAVDVQQPSRVVKARMALRYMAEQNFGGDAQAMDDRLVGGTKISLPAQQLSAQWARPDHDVLQARMLFFFHESWVFQVTVMGSPPQSEAIDFFFDSLLVGAQKP
jgi:hypothetical protein